MLNLVKELCLLNGVSSGEDDVRDYLMERCRPYAASMRVDALGNLIVFKRGEMSTGSRLMLTAHMDEVGFIVNYITEDGYLKFAPVGGIDPLVVIGKRVSVGRGRIPGAIGLKAYHLVSAEEEKKVPKLDDLYVDIGAGSRAEAQELVAVVDSVTFVSDSVPFGSGMLKAKALDDRIGCAVMMKLLEEELPLDTTFVFTVQEEVGSRGAFGAAFSVQPELALVLETTTAADLPGVGEEQRVCAPGKGPVIPFMDLGCVADRELFELLRRTARENGIPWQTKHYLSGGNDAAAIQRTRTGVRTATLAAAVRYLHAPASVASVRDMEDMLKLARLFLHAVAQRV